MTGGLPIRICFPFVGDTIGGSHISTLALIDELDRNTFDPVLVLHKKDVFADYLDARGVAYVIAPGAELSGKGRTIVRLLAALRCALIFAPFLRAQQIDIVHTNDARMHLSWGFAARFSGAKFVWHQRTPMALGKSAYMALLAHELLVVSEYSRGTCPGLTQRKARVLDNPVQIDSQIPDRAQAREKILKDLSLPVDAKLIAFVGNIQGRKRPLVFIETAAKVKEYYEGEVHYLVFGAEREPLASRVRERIKKLKLDSVFHLMGGRFPIEAWLAGCDIYMTPAVNEGFGRVPVEAMMVGTPVIASKMGGHVEFIEDGKNGLLVPPDDPPGFAKAAVRLLKDESFAETMARTARQPAIERYSPKRHAEAIQKTYLRFFDKRHDCTTANDITFIIADMGSGGAQRVAVNLVKAWVDQGQRVHVITWKPPESDFFQFPAEVRRSVLGPRPQNSGRVAAHLSNIKAMIRIRRSLRQDKPKAVVSFITVTNIFVILASLGLKPRLVVSERNDPTRQNAGPIWAALRWILYRFADVVTANSQQAVQAMSSYVPARKLAVVHNPVTLPAEVAVSERSEILLNIGRLVPQKGQDLIITALSLLGAKAENWRIEVFGEGPERQNLIALSKRLGVAERVSLPGTVPDPSPYYRRAGIFVLSSLYEGTPNVLLEAMAHGMACVVSDSVPGALEHVEDHVSGLVFRSGDAEHLAQCLSKLLEQPELRSRLGQEARRRMAAYSMENIASEWKQILSP